MGEQKKAITRFEDLMVWQMAEEMTIAIYRITRNSAFVGDFPLRDQIRRAAISTMSNIAEGFERYSRPEFKQFLSIARGSAAEVRSQLSIANKLGYLKDEEFRSIYPLSNELSRRIAALRKSLKPK